MHLTGVLFSISDEIARHSDPHSLRTFQNALVKIAGVLVLLTGIPLALGGTWLVRLGGSPYYIFAGMALIVSGALLLRRRMAGVWIFGVFLAVTIVWSLWEGGFTLWALIPRLIVPLLLAVAVALSVPLLQLEGTRRSSQFVLAYSIAAVFSVVLLGMGAVAIIPRPIIAARSLIAGHAAHPAGEATETSASAEWRHYGRTVAGTRFSPLEQINPQNVHRLEVAWTYRTGGALEGNDAHQATPLQVGRNLYLCTHRNEVIALDGQSGKPRWRFESAQRTDDVSTLPRLGVLRERAASGSAWSAVRAAGDRLDYRCTSIRD